MDLKKAKILIEKINSLHKSMGADTDGVAAIEKDLMLSYVRQLYEVFLLDTSVITKSAPKVEIIKSSPKPKPRKKPTPVKLEVITPDPAPIVEVPKEVEPPVVVTPPMPVRRAPRVIEVPDSLADVQTPAPKPMPTPAPVSKPKPTPPPVAKPIAIKIDNEELSELFEHSSSRELSEKLSNLPIRDLRKAMGLNEKIFTINELFGGEQDAYEKAVSNLNGMSSFEEAKVYLIENVADKYSWTDAGKTKKAKNFIKLVRRRYS